LSFSRHTEALNHTFQLVSPDYSKSSTVFLAVRMQSVVLLIALLTYMFPSSPSNR